MRYFSPRRTRPVQEPKNTKRKSSIFQLHTNRHRLWTTTFSSEIKQNQCNKSTTRAKDVLPNIHRTQTPEITPRQGRNGAICHCSTMFAASAYHSYTAGGVMAALSAFFVPWGPWHSNSSSEGLNTSSLCIWRKSVHMLPRYQRHKQKKQSQH